MLSRGLDLQVLDKELVLKATLLVLRRLFECVTSRIELLANRHRARMTATRPSNQQQEQEP